MKKTIVFALFIGNLFSIQAQEIERKNAITFDIAPLIVQPSRFSFGYMRNINERFFVAGELGYSFSENMGRMNNKSTDYKQVQYRAEVGYILSPEKKYVFHFLSMDFQHINHKETLYDGHFRGDDLNDYGGEVFYKYSQVNYHRVKNSLSFNYGLMIYFGKEKRVGVIPKIGLAIKHVDVDFSNAKNLQEDNEFEWGWLDFGNRYKREGKEREGTFNFQIKFFFKF